MRHSVHKFKYILAIRVRDEDKVQRNPTAIEQSADADDLAAAGPDGVDFHWEIQAAGATTAPWP